jgi:4-hydroxy-2-oxoheptanedioate aldolase
MYFFRLRQLTYFFLILLFSVDVNIGQDSFVDNNYQPKRVNKSIELFEAGQPVYYKYTKTTDGYKEGLEMAKTWADYIVYDMEHRPLDFARLREFMRGLVDGGPTPSGHRTPAVIVVLPVLGVDEISFMGGSWMVQQALATGVHGIHLPRARDPKAVRKYVQAARYPIHKKGVDAVGEGVRGWGSHKFAAWVWGVEEEEYLKKADVWPLNPDGEIMLGVKIEDPIALVNAEETLAIPGLAFAEHGPRDFGFSLGFLEGRADPPVPEGVSEAGDIVLDLCKTNGLYFLDNVLPDNVKVRVDKGVMIGAGSNEEAAEVGRAYTKRKMPWK